MASVACGFARGLMVGRVPACEPARYVVDPSGIPSLFQGHRVVDHHAVRRIDPRRPRRALHHPLRVGVSRLPAGADAGRREIDVLRMILALELRGNQPRDAPPRNPLTSRVTPISRAMRFTVATYNIHKGFTQLKPADGDPRAARAAARALRRHPVPAGSGRRPPGTRGAARRLAGEAAARVHRRHRLARSRLRQERDRRARAITAMPCCRAIRSSRRRTWTSRRTRSKAAGLLHCAIQLGRRRADAALPQRAPGTVRARPAVADARAVRAHPRDGAQGRAARHRRRLQRLAAQGESPAGRRARRRSKSSSRCAAGRRARFRR